MKHTSLVFLSWLMLSILVAGCSSGNVTVERQSVIEANASALGNVEYHTHQLANELLSQVESNRQSRYAVVHFVPIDSFDFEKDKHHPLAALGHQLRDGMLTEITKRGFVAQDFLVTNDIVIDSDHASVFSADLDVLADAHAIDYYLSGTILQQQEGAVVNARIINVRTKNVLASATRFFPAELFWRKEQVTTRNGLLYRERSYATN